MARAAVGRGEGNGLGPEHHRQHRADVDVARRPRYVGTQLSGRIAMGSKVEMTQHNEALVGLVMAAAGRRNSGNLVGFFNITETEAP